MTPVTCTKKQADSSGPLPAQGRIDWKHTICIQINIGPAIYQ